MFCDWKSINADGWGTSSTKTNSKLLHFPLSWMARYLSSEVTRSPEFLDGLR